MVRSLLQFGRIDSATPGDFPFVVFWFGGAKWGRGTHARVVDKCSVFTGSWGLGDLLTLALAITRCHNKPKFDRHCAFWESAGS